MSINSVILTGNVTRDSELRFTASGAAILDFGVACNERVKNKQTGVYEDYPNFIDCTLFGTRAEKLESMVLKGTKVTVKGRFHQDRWQDKQGKNCAKIIVYVDDIDLMQKPKSEKKANPPEEVYEDIDLPF